jgi:hypothetical protein
LLGERDDTISYILRGPNTPLDPPITYKRFRSAEDFTIETVTHDVITDVVPFGAQITPQSDRLDAIGIDVSYPADLADRKQLKRIRVYFDSDENNQLNPEWVLNPLDGTANAGLQVRNADGTLLPTLQAFWKRDYVAGYIPYNTSIPNPASPPHNYRRSSVELPAGTVLTQFKSSDNLIWYDADFDGVWSNGDALWVRGAGSLNTDTFDSGDTLLAGKVLTGARGVLVTGDTYGFAYYDNNGNGDFDYPLAPGSTGDDIYFLGGGRSTLGYFADLTLSPAATLPSEPTDSIPDFLIACKANSNPKIFGLLQFKLSLPAAGIIYGNENSSEHSYASSNVTTNLITMKSIPGAITDFTARPGRANGEPTVTLNWKLPADKFDNILIIRSEHPSTFNSYMAFPDGYPTMKRYYSASAEEYQRMIAYQRRTTGFVSNANINNYVPDNLFAGQKQKVYMPGSHPIYRVLGIDLTVFHDGTAYIDASDGATNRNTYTYPVRFPLVWGENMNLVQETTLVGADDGLDFILDDTTNPGDVVTAATNLTIVRVGAASPYTYYNSTDLANPLVPVDGKYETTDGAANTVEFTEADLYPRWATANIGGTHYFNVKIEDITVTKRDGTPITYDTIPNQYVATSLIDGMTVVYDNTETALPFDLDTQKYYLTNNTDTVTLSPSVLVPVYDGSVRAAEKYLCFGFRASCRQQQGDLHRQGYDLC